MPASPLLSAQAVDRLARAAAASPADETAITCVVTRRLTASTRSGGPRPAVEEEDVQVRVLEAGRPGAFRPAGATPEELELAVRHALAQSRGAAPLPGEPVLLPPAAPATVGDRDLFDPAVAELEPEAAQNLLRELAAPGESARLSWSEAAVVAVGNRGARRQVRLTAAALEVRCKRQPGAGSAASAARSLAALRPEEVFARARRRDGGELPVGEWQEPRAVVLTPEAAAALVASLGGELLAAAAWERADGYGPRHRDAAIFAPEIALLDDPASPAGLPLPLGRSGGMSATGGLVLSGVLQGPAADLGWAARLGVPATLPVWTGEPTHPEHLTLPAGALSEEGLLQAAGDGVLVGEVERVEVWDGGRLAATVAVRGVRRIAGGALAEPLPDALWEVALPAAFGRVLGVGVATVAREDPGGLGAASAPGLALAGAGVWTPRA